MGNQMQLCCQVLTDYFKSEHSALEILHRDDGNRFEMPISVHFWEANDVEYNEMKCHSLLMLSHGMGMVRDLSGFNRFLVHAYELTEPGAIIVFDSLGVHRTNDPVHMAYQERNKKVTV